MVRSFMTLYQSWFCGHDQVERLLEREARDVERHRPRDDRCAPCSTMTLMPVMSAMNLRMSWIAVLWRSAAERRLRRRVQDRRLGLAAGALAHRIDPRRLALGLGLLAQLPLELGAALCRLRVARRELDAPCGTRAMAFSSSPFASSSRALSMCAFEAACIARSSAILYSGRSGILLHRLGVVGDGRIPVAGAASSSPRRKARLVPQPDTASGEQDRGERPRRRVLRPRLIGIVRSTSRVRRSARAAWTAAPRRLGVGTHWPDNRIVWRPRPSTYSICIDSSPICTMR